MPQSRTSGAVRNSRYVVHPGVPWETALVGRKSGWHGKVYHQAAQALTAKKSIKDTKEFSLLPSG